MSIIIFNDGTNGGTPSGMYVTNAGGTPSIQTGTLAGRPAFGTAGRIYVATDTQQIFEDTGEAWILIGSGAAITGYVANAGNTPSIQTGTLAGRPAFGTAGRVYIAIDTQQIFEDTGVAWEVIGFGAVTANNGLTASTPSNVQLGGTLNKNTGINTFDGVNVWELDLGRNDGYGTIRVLNNLVEIGLDGGNQYLILQSGEFHLRCYNAGNYQGIDATADAGIPMMVTDEEALFGMRYAADYSAAGSLSPLWIPNYGAVLAAIGGGGGGNVASNKVAGAMASENLITYAIPESTPTQFQVVACAVFRSGAGTAAITLQWTDTGTVVNTVTLQTLTGAGNTPNASVSVYCKNGTNILVNLVITGTAIADVASAIKFVN